MKTSRKTNLSNVNFLTVLTVGLIENDHYVDIACPLKYLLSSKVDVACSLGTDQTPPIKSHLAKKIVILFVSLLYFSVRICPS